MEEIDYFVDGVNGKDWYPGTIKYPFNTIKRAIKGPCKLYLYGFRVKQ
jgi:hypothetical protein